MTSSQSQLQFPSVGKREVVATFDGGDVTSDAGVLLLAHIDRSAGLTESIANALIERRDLAKVRHPLLDLVKTRVYGICLGYPDANDFDSLGSDGAFKMSLGRAPATGEDLGSQPTISRFENGRNFRELLRALKELAENAVSNLPKTSKRIDIDIDSTEDPAYGHQQLALFNGYAKHAGYRPLLVFVTGQDKISSLAAPILRPGNTAEKRQVIRVLKRLVRMIRQRCPKAKICLRGDAAFGIEEIMTFCEEHKFGYLLALAGRPKVKEAAQEVVEACTKRLVANPRIQSSYGEFPHKAKTWPAERRVIVTVRREQDKLKALYLVTNLQSSPRDLKRDYNQRGDIENRIKEVKLDLSSGRTSCSTFLANMFRLLLHGAAFNLLTLLRKHLAGTEWARSQFSTLQLRLLKVGAKITETARKIRLQMPSSYPLQQIWELLHQKLLPKPG